MREMERMSQLEQDLMSGNFDTISMDDLQRAARASRRMQDFQNLRQVMLLLKQVRLPDAEGRAHRSSRPRACAGSASWRCAISTRAC